MTHEPTGKETRCTCGRHPHRLDCALRAHWTETTDVGAAIVQYAEHAAPETIASGIADALERAAEEISETSRSFVGGGRAAALRRLAEAARALASEPTIPDPFRETPRRWLEAVTRALGGGFHPDTDPADYEPALSTRDQERLAAGLHLAFESLKDEVYEICLATLHEGGEADDEATAPRGGGQ